MSTNSFFNALLPGKWKGVYFYVSKETIQAIGQKYIQHDYPGTNLRYMEPHGKAPFQATMDIVFPGITFVSDFKNFKAAMEDPNPGILYLPTLGVFTNIIAQQADATSDQNNFGEIPLTVTFTETTPQPSPTTVEPGQQDVFLQSINVLQDAQNAFENNFISPSTLNNLQTAISDINSIISISQNICGAYNVASTFINSLISNPIALAESIFNPNLGVIAVLNTALSSQNQAYVASRNMTTVGNTLSNSLQDITSNFVLKQVGIPPAITINTGINVWPGTTYEQKQRNINRYCIVNAFRIAGLVMMCQQAGLQVFTTANQVQSVISDIQNYFNLLIENDTTGYIIQDCKISLEILKNNTISTLNSIAQQLNNTTTIVLEKPMSPRVLAYEIYGEYMQNSNDLDTYSDILLSLNASYPVHLFPAGQPITILQMS